MNIEKIKFGNEEYDLVPAGVKLGPAGGAIIFQRGNHTFDEVEAVLKQAANITQIGLSGEPDWTRADLIYTDKLTKQSDYVISTEQIECGTDEITGDPIYTVADIKGDVMIAEFKTPDLASKVAAINAKVEYLAMMSNVNMGRRLEYEQKLY